MDLPCHGENGFQQVRCVRRYLEVMFPCRFCILLTFLVNRTTGSVCMGLLPSFTVFGQQIPLCSTKSQPQDCLSLLNLLLLDVTFLTAAFTSTRQGMHPSVALEKSTLRQMSLVQYSSCCRVSPTLSASPYFKMQSDSMRRNK